MTPNDAPCQGVAQAGHRGATVPFFFVLGGVPQELLVLDHCVLLVGKPEY
jgi:hypothetical protein